MNKRYNLVFKEDPITMDIINEMIRHISEDPVVEKQKSAAPIRVNGEFRLDKHHKLVEKIIKSL